MSWFTETVEASNLTSEMVYIRSHGGVVVRAIPASDHHTVEVLYYTND